MKFYSATQKEVYDKRRASINREYIEYHEKSTDRETFLLNKFYQWFELFDKSTSWQKMDAFR